MTDLLTRLRRFLRELKRRHVFRVAAVYAVVAWVVIQVASVVLPRLQLPGWADELMIAIAALGCPIAILLVWAFKMTDAGGRRDVSAVHRPV